jgi:AAA family ATP:ADP antiporter
MANVQTMGTEIQTPSLVYRFLRLFTDIRQGEALTALLLMLNVFFLLSAYYILKPIREALMLEKWTPEAKSYMGVAQAFILIFLVKIFSRLASKVPRQILITRVILFFISNLILFYLLHGFGVSGKALAMIFFIWVGIFNVMVIAQFWAFANDIYTLEAGKRLFPIVAFGATFGGYIGSELTKRLAKSQSVYQMMLVAAAILGICILFTFIVHKREVGLKKKLALKTGESRQEQIVQIDAEKPVEKGGGFRLLGKSRYLLLIAFFVLLLNFVNTNGQYILDNVVVPAAKKAAAAAAVQGPQLEQFKQQFIAKFFADFNAIMNLWAMFVQLFLVSRIFKWFGVRVAMFFLPLIALSGYSAISLGASLVLVKWVKALENGSDYSIMNTSRHALFLITTREEKYKAKAAIDTFFQRTGDTLSALLVFLNVTFLSFRIETLSFINAAAVLIWIFVGILIFKTHKKLTAAKAAA